MISGYEVNNCCEVNRVEWMIAVIGGYVVIEVGKVNRVDRVSKVDIVSMGWIRGG